MRNVDAAAMLISALEAGVTLTIPTNNGDTVTVGKHPEFPTWTAALRWGRSRFARPSGLLVAESPQTSCVAWEVVRHCGRGNVADAVRKYLN